MKVETDLRAGNVLDDAAQGANELMNQVNGFLTSASVEAEGLTNTVTTKATSLWNCLVNTFS